MMHLYPILKTLWRSKTGPALIIIQLALSIAMISNALFFVQTRMEQIARPTGFAEAQLAKLWIKEGNTGLHLQQRVTRDLEIIQNLPGVRGVAPISSVPFSHAGYSSGVHNKHSSESDEGRLRTPAGVAETDYRALDVLGLKLRAGRNFLAEESVYFTKSNMPSSAQAIITQSVADDLFPQQSAVGKTLYMGGEAPLTVVGVVEDFLGYFPNLDFAERNVLVSAIEDWGSINYLMRGETGQLENILDAASTALRDADPQRIVDNTATLKALINDHYHADYAMIILLCVVIALLALINMLGIVGITTFWVNQRRRQIGIRRALGATRTNIIQLFLLENTLLVAAATALGAMIALWCNLYLVQRYAFEFLPWFYIPLAGIVLLAITLAAAARPARNAALISPRAAIAN